jgi:hypothetical protein
LEGLAPGRRHGSVDGLDTVRAGLNARSVILIIGLPGRHSTQAMVILMTGTAIEL